MIRTGFAFALTLLFLVHTDPAHAQAPPVPTREEVLRDPLPTDRSAPEDRSAGGIERSPCPLAQPRFDQVSFVLQGASFNNLLEVDPAVLKPAYADYLGREIPLRTVCDIRDRAATILRSNGFLAAVQVPPQEIDDSGIVRFDVLSARVARLQLRGDAGNSERLIASYVSPIGDQAVFNERQAERALMLVQNLPGFQSRLGLRATETPGEVIGDIRVRRSPYFVDAAIQNYGSRAAGRFGGQIRVQLNDLVGTGDRTVVSAFSSADFQEQFVLGLAHDSAVGSDGLRLGGRVSYSRNDPTLGGISPFETETIFAGIFARYPFVLDQGTQISGTLGVDVLNQDVEFGGTLINRDRLRVVYARADFGVTDRASIGGLAGYSANEPRWRLGMNVELRKGLDIAGATMSGLAGANGVPQIRADGKSDAFVVRIQGLAEFRPTPQIAFVLRPQAQITGDALLAFEELSGGNFSIGRGYDPGAVIGDRGGGVAAEIQFGSVIGRADRDFAFQPYGFFDTLWTDNVDRGLGGGSDDLQSAGVGLRTSYRGRAHLDLTLAVPLSRTSNQIEKPDARLLMSMFVRFGS